jgi:hypothetical protein
MSSQSEPQGPKITVTKHRQGLTIKIKEQNPERRYLPVDARVIRRAVSESGRLPKHKG